MKAAAIILAAGASTRLGQPKQLVILAGERLLDRAVRVAHEAGCNPIIVVLGASAQTIQETCRLDHCTIAINPDWAEGMASSIRHGVSQLAEDCDAALLLTCDQPAVTASHLTKLIESCKNSPVASFYAGKRGVPACLPAMCFEELMKLRGDEGASRLLASAPAIELPGGELDIDTPLALDSAKSVYR